jgi:serine O-acetyltransferase
MFVKKRSGGILMSENRPSARQAAEQPVTSSGMERLQREPIDRDSFRWLARALYLDYRRYVATGDGGFFSIVFLSQGFWACSVHRVSKYLLGQVRFAPFRKALRAFLAVAQKGVEITTGICMAPECQISEGFYVGHFGGIFIHKDSPIGRNCNISQGVTIGIGGRGDKRGVPKIGDRVYIGANAILVGDIVIGEDAAIGAGAVVTKSVPPRGNVLGNPARVISSQGSFDFIQYDGMDDDPDRLESIQLAVSLTSEP